MPNQAFDWSAYLDLAKTCTTHCILSDSQNNTALEEAKLRSSTSRAYYSIFLRSRNYVRDSLNTDLPKNGTVHRRVFTTLRGSNSRDQKNLSELLHRLRRFRNQADYDDRIQNLPSAQKAALIWAETAHELLNNLEHPSA
jgi:uncharacterized protein (UPF0332 family)